MNVNKQLTFRTKFLIVCWACASVFMLNLCHVAKAANDTWSGAGGTVNFNLSTNWNALPVSTDSIFFTSTNGAPSSTLNNDFATDFTFNGITFNAGTTVAYTLGGNEITLGGNITNSSTTAETIGFNMVSTAVRNVTATAGGGNVVINGNVSGLDAGITAVSANTTTGTITLNGANTYFGGTTVGSTGNGSAVTLVIGNSLAVQNSLVTLAVNVTASQSSNNTLKFASGGTYFFGGLASAAATNGSTSNISLQDSSANAANIVVGSDNLNTTYAGILSGAGGLTKTGFGTLILSGATNSYAGGVTLNNGELSVGVDANLGSSTDSITFNGGILQITGTSLTSFNSHTVNYSTFNGGIDVNSASNTFTISNAITNPSEQFVKMGAGTLVFAPGITNTYGGGNVVFSGTLQGDTSSIQGNVSLHSDWVFGSATAAPSVLVFNQSGNGTYSGAITGIGSVTLSGSGKVTLANANNYNGATTVGGSNILALGNNNSVQNSTVTLQGGTNSLVFNSGVDAPNIGGLSGSGDIALTDAGSANVALTVGSNNSTNAFSSNLTGGGSFTKAGTGTLTLSNSVLGYTGTTTVNGGVLSINGSLASTVLVLGGGTLQVANGAIGATFSTTAFNAGASGVDGSLASANVALGTTTRNAGATANFLVPSGFFITSSLADSVGSGGAAIIGGWATVNGTDWATNDGTNNVIALAPAGYTANSWTAGVNNDVTASGTVSGGTTNTVRFNTGAAITEALSGTNVISSGGILVTSAVGTNATVISGGTLEGSAGGELIINQFNTGGSLTISSTISNNGSATGLTKSGAGTVILTGANNYTGNTIIGAGILQISDSGILPQTGNITNNGTLAFANTSALTFTKAIAGAGATTFTGTSATLDYTSSAVTANMLSTGALTLNGSSLSMLGKVSTPDAQSFSNTIFNAGVANVTVTAGSSGSAALNLGSLNIASGVTGTIANANLGLGGYGAAIRFNGPATIGASNAAVAATGTITTTTGSVWPQGIMGTFSGSSNTNPIERTGANFTVGLYDWAAVKDSTTFPIGSSTSFPYTIVGGSQITNFYTSIWQNANENFDVVAGGDTQTAQSGGTQSTMLTMRFNDPNALTFAVRATLTTVGGILVTPNIGANNATINGAGGFQVVRATQNGPQQIVIWQNDTLGFLNINLTSGGAFTDGRAGTPTPTYVTKAGAGTLQLQSQATYTGGTFIDEGTLLFSNDNQLGAVPAAPAAGQGINLAGGALVASANLNLDDGTNKRLVSLLGSGGTLAATTGNTMTVTGVISGSTGTLTIGSGTIAGTGAGTANTTALIGNGQVALAGANTYTRNTNVVGGTLLATNTTGSATGTGNISVASSAGFGGSGTVSGLVSIAAGGHLTPGVNGINNGIGNITVGGATLASSSIFDVDLSSAANDLVTSSNGLTLTSNDLINLFAASSGITRSANALNGSFTLMKITGSITGATLDGSGHLTNFVVNNPATGGVYTFTEAADITPGITDINLSITGLASSYFWIGSGSTGNWPANGNWTSSSSTSFPQLPGDSATFDAAHSTATGPVSVKLNGNQLVGQLTFNDTNAQFSIDPTSPGDTLTLNNNGSASGISDISTPSSTSALHAITANVALANDLNVTVVSNNETFTIAGAISGAHNLTVASGSGTLLLTNSTANSYLNTTINSGLTLAVGNGTTVGSLGTGTITDNGTLTINHSDPVSLNAISGSGTLIQAGSGTTTLSTVNSGAWSTNVSGGKLLVGTGSNLGSGNLTVDGMLDLNGYSPSIGSLSSVGTAGVVNNTAAGAVTITSTTNNSTIYSGTIQNTGGAVSLVKTGSGTLTLKGIGTYSGSTTINGGAIDVASSTAVAAGTTVNINVDRGLLLGDGTSNNVNLAANILMTPTNATTADQFDLVAGSTVTLSGNITTSNTNPGGAQIRLSAGNDTATNLTILGNMTIPNAASNLFVLERGNWIFGGNSVVNSTPSIWLGRSAGSTVTFTFEGNTNVTAPTYDVGGNNGVATTSITTTIQDNAVVTATSTDASATGGGFYLNAGNGGSTTLNLNGGTLKTIALRPGATATTINLNGTQIVALGNNMTGVAGAVGFLPTSGSSAQVGDGGAIFNTNGFNIEIDASLNGFGAGGLTKNGVGTLQLGNSTTSVSNSWAGHTQINQGTLALENGFSLPGSAKLVLNSGALSTAGFSQSSGQLQLQDSSILNLQGNPLSSVTFQFSNSNDVLDPTNIWTSGKVLRIYNWFGNSSGATLGGGPDQILLGSDNTGLDASQLSEIHFVGYGNGAQILSTGEIVPLTNTEAFLPGDWNRDGHVDAHDILTMESALANIDGYESAHPGLTTQQLLDIGDINADGVINNADLQGLLNYLIAGNGSTAPVPEPASVVLLGLGTLVFGARRLRSRR